MGLTTIVHENLTFIKVSDLEYEMGLKQGVLFGLISSGKVYLKFPHNNTTKQYVMPIYLVTNGPGNAKFISAFDADAIMLNYPKGNVSSNKSPMEEE